MNARKIIITSGFFNPIHVGHLNLLKEAKSAGDFLVVIVNNDDQVRLKGSVDFMPEQERMALIESIKYVDAVFLSIDRFADKDGIPIPESLRAVSKLYPGELFFAKGGDRNYDNIPEVERKVCDECKIRVISNVGGGKVQSSSWLINNISKK
jgi:cytidyltransferase-like protein